MLKEVIPDNKDLGDSPYSDRIGIIHIINDVDTNGKPYRATGKLIAIFGQNLLFEKVTGRRFLVNPATASRIIELPDRGK
jgi:hypothetical protein